MSSRTTQFTSLTESVSFPIEGSTLTLLMTVDRKVRLDNTALRNVFYNAYTFVSNVIDVSGDGDLPASCDPYKELVDGAFIRLDSDARGRNKLKWSDVKEILWGLRDFMVVQGNSFRLAFIIKQEGQAGDLGYGRVLKDDPFPSPLTQTFNSSGISRLYC